MLASAALVLMDDLLRVSYNVNAADTAHKNIHFNTTVDKENSCK
jgi:hypothetical protein